MGKRGRDGEAKRTAANIQRSTSKEGRGRGKREVDGEKWKVRLNHRGRPFDKLRASSENRGVGAVQSVTRGEWSRFLLQAICQKSMTPFPAGHDRVPLFVGGGGAGGGCWAGGGGGAGGGCEATFGGGGGGDDRGVAVGEVAVL